MTIKKKLLSVVLSLALALQVGAVALPVCAEEGGANNLIVEETPELTPMEQLWYDTNLVVNGDAEIVMEFDENDNVASESNPKQGEWNAKENAAGVEITAEQSHNQAYRGTTSILVKKGGPVSDHGIFTPIVHKSKMKENTTYIANMKILGTQKNANEGWDTVQNKGSQWENKVSFRPYFNSFVFSGFSEYNVYSLNTLADAPYADAQDQGSPLDESYWKDITATFTTGSTLVECYGFGIAYQDYNSEFYTDNYYLGALMVADIKTNDISVIQVPEQGETETVELKATALNQLGTTAGLEDSEFVWSLADEYTGVSIEDNILTVTDAAQVGELLLTVTCEPKFAGAEDQKEYLSKELMALREKKVTVTIKELTEEEKKAAFIKETNMIGSNFDFEESQTLDGWYKSGSIKAAISDKQSYSGKYSLLQNVGAPGDYYYRGVKGLRPSATYIVSMMILGTRDNAAIETAAKYPGTPLNVYFGSTPNSGMAERIDYLKVPVKDASSAPLSTDENQEGVMQSDWINIWGIMKTMDDEKVSANYIGPGIHSAYPGLEFYTDDYYMGELVVYNVENKTVENTVTIPTGSENAELELKAEAYNQFGDQRGLEGTTYTWEIADDDKSGVSIEDGKLIVTNDAYVRKLNLKVTANPAFLGAETQTNRQKNGRTNNVQIKLVASPGASEEPQAKNIRIEGDVLGTNTLKLKYDFWQLSGDKEGASVIRWYKSTTPDGPWDDYFQETTLQDPLKEVKDEYKLKEGDDAYFYRAEVIPVTESGKRGSLAETVVYGKPVPPVALNVKVSGVQAYDEPWTVSYDYSDVNNDKKKETKYQWYVSPTDKIEDGKAIEGEDAKKETFKVTKAYEGQYIYVGVTPVSEGKLETTGKEAYSTPRLTSAKPYITNLKIVKESNYLTVDYNYVHPLGIDQGESKVEWYDNVSCENSIGEGTSLNVSNLKGKTIYVKVTPVAVKEPSTGEPDTASYKVPTTTTSSVGGVGGSGGGGSFKPSAPVKPAEVQNIPSWAKAEVDFVLTNKIMELSADNDFAGSNKINRGEFMMAMLKAAGIQPNDYRGSFADVTSLDKFSGYLQAAFDQGVIASAENFYPARELTRDEMCKIIVTSIEAMTKKEISKAAITHFTDYSSIQSWALDFISEAVDTGIIKGNADGSMNPKGNVTRAEAAVVANRIAEYVKAEGGLK